VLYSGAYGAGKTLALCLKLLSRALVPGAREGLFRQTLQDLYGTTLATLLEGDGEMPALLPPGTYDHNQQRRRIRIHGGGTILYGGLEEEDRIGSLNLTGAAVDEATELPESAWIKIGGRLRVRREGLARQLYAACNPGPPSHHLAKRFGIKRSSVVPELSFKGDEKRPLRCEAITTNSFDNVHLPPDYLARLAAYTGVMRSRYVLGEWIGSDGLIYQAWSRDVHMRARTELWDCAWITMDDGTAVPFAAELVYLDRDGGMHVAKNVYRTRMEPDEKVRAILGLRDLAKCRFEGVVVDPAAAAMKQRLRENGLIVYDGENEVLPGIAEVQNRLNIGPSGLPGLTVDPSCEDVAEEFESYEWDTDFKGDKPVKAHDHSLDGIRYLCQRLKRPAAAAVDLDIIADLKRDIAAAPVAYVGDIASILSEGIDREASLRRGDVSSVRFRSPTPANRTAPWRFWVPLRAGSRPDQKRPYVVACSVGSGAPGSLTCIKVGDAELRTVVGQAEWLDLAPEAAARLAVMACLWWGGIHTKPRLIWKDAGPGIAFGDAVRRLAYGGAHRHQDEDGKATDRAGWQWTQKTAHAILGQFRGDVVGTSAGRYIERDPGTPADLSRWVFHPSGKLGPATLDVDGETVEGASDRAWAAMLLNHAMGMVARLPKPTLRPAWGSVEWLDAEAKRAKEATVV